MEGKVVGEKVEGESNGSRMSENYNISDLVWKSLFLVCAWEET